MCLLAYYAFYCAVHLHMARYRYEMASITLVYCYTVNTGKDMPGIFAYSCIVQHPGFLRLFAIMHFNSVVSNEVYFVAI